MALNSEITVNNTVEQPIGYTPPTITISLNSPSEHVIDITTSAPTVDNPNAVTGITALIADIKSQIDTTELGGLGVDFVGNNIDAIYRVITVRRTNGDSVYNDGDDFVSRVQITWNKV